MKIEFGGGKSPKKINWIQCDIQDLPNIDIVCDAWKITDHVEKNSVEEIYSRHFLEHLTFAQAEACIKSWSAILKPDGKIQIIVPNLEWHFKQFFDPQRHEKKIGNTNETIFERAVSGLYGKQTNGLEEVWDVHKSGWDFEMLEKLLSDNNFKDIRRVEDLIKNLNIIAKKE